MTSYILQFFVFLFMSMTMACSTGKTAASTAVTAPSSPASASPSPAAKGEQVAVFSGGCFWGVEAVFEHVKGVTDVTSGYSGGSKETADYETVSGGKTGHAESVKVKFDPSIVTYPQLLEVFFSVAHDPTQLNYQGPDHGTQYRSAIFYTDDGQRQAALAYIEEMKHDKVYSAPIVTQVVPLEAFYEAEAYHQDYMKHNPNEPYIVYNDAPKVAALKKKFPDRYVEK
jgi:peptide-methionine (S)-S-oxide reductase